MGLVALRKDDFVLALFRGSAPPGQVNFIGLTMAPEELAGIRARLPQDTQTSEGGPNFLGFTDPYQITWQLSVPGNEFRTSGELADRWIKL